MGAHFTYIQGIIPDPDLQKFAMATVVGLGLVGTAFIASRRIATDVGRSSQIVPSKEFSIFGLFDFVLDGFVRFQDSILGKENRQYAPLCATLFLFILASNLLGLIPGVPAITTTIWVNVGIAFVVFFAFNTYGVRANGVLGYLKHFCGPVWWLAPLILVLELFSTCLRILTLNLRLYWNITADHQVIEAFTDLVPYIVPCLFYAFGTFVAFMQAFVFTVLTMIYILLATQHEEAH